VWVQLLGRICKRRSVILGYHGIGSAPLKDDLSMLVVAPSRFEGHIELLGEAGFRFCTVADLAARAGGAEPPPGWAAISFDDGMRNNHSIALPILRAHGIPATVYVTIGFIDGMSPWVSGGEGAMLNRAEISELADAGWELGAHTMTHPDLAALSYERCRQEIAESIARLEEISARPVKTLAYPSGRYGQAAIDAARDCGLSAAVTTGSGSWAPFELTRAMIGSRDPMAVVMLKLDDRYEPLLEKPPLPQIRSGSKRMRTSMQRTRRRRPDSGIGV
jgi:peptidoglycan/xylan/chitin deacetylase (PgdA/CDA1 family)